MGLMKNRKPTAPRSKNPFSANKDCGLDSKIKSITNPISAAVNVSTTPDRMLATAASVNAVYVPFKHHLINANNVRGGGVFTSCSGVIQFLGCIII